MKGSRFLGPPSCPVKDVDGNPQCSLLLWIHRQGQAISSITESGPVHSATHDCPGNTECGPLPKGGGPLQRTLVKYKHFIFH